MKKQGYIVNKGMGGFLNPPTHPEHDRSVQGKNFSMSLTGALEADWLTDHTKLKAKTILDAWEPLRLDLVKDWIYQVLGYFHDCYVGQDEQGNASWNADKLRIAKIDPMLNIDLHAGVHLIRKYYPEYVPIKEDFDNAYWGTK